MHTIHQFDLQGGARALVVTIPGARARVLGASLNAGYQFADRLDLYEVPHVLEHVLVTCSALYPEPNGLAIAAERSGATWNAHTDTIRNGFWWEFGPPETTERMGGLLTEALTRPLLDPLVVDRAVGIVREELARATTIHHRVAEITREEHDYPGRSVVHRTRLGLLDYVHVERLREHYRTAYTASNLRLYAAGAFDAGGVAAVVDQFERLAARLPRGSRLLPDQTPGRGMRDPVVIDQDLDSITYDWAAYLGPTSIRDRQALELLRVLLTEARSSRVFGRARNAGLAYGVGSRVTAESSYGELSVYGEVSPTNTEALFTLLGEQLRAIAAGDVGDDELQAAKDFAVGRLGLHLQTPRSLYRWYAGQFDLDEADEAGGVDHLDTYIAGLRAVTAEEIAATARRLFGARGLALVGPVKPSLAQTLGELVLTVE